MGGGLASQTSASRTGLTRFLCLRRIILIAVLLLILVLFLGRVKRLVFYLGLGLSSFGITSLDKRKGWEGG